MPAIDAEVRICCEDHRIGKRFGHSHKAGIGEAHGHVRVFLQELKHWLDVAIQVEGGNQGTAADQRRDSGHSASTEKVDRLREYSFAGAPGWSVVGRLSHRPIVVGVAAAKQRY